MLVKTSILVIGCGNMGAALASGYSAAFPHAEVVAIDRDPQRAQSLLPADCQVSVIDSPDRLGDWQPNLVILALKPQVLGDCLPALSALCASALVVSIAAGSSLRRIREMLGGHRRIVRAMPNLPVVAGQGMTLLYADNDDLKPGDGALCQGVFDSVGEIAWVGDEASIDAGTAVAGSGPAYFFAVVEQLAAAGVAEGLPPALAEQLARQTCIGAAALLASDSRTPRACSPRGTTEAGLAAMEQPGGLSVVIGAGVTAAHARARELAAA